MSRKLKIILIVVVLVVAAIAVTAIMAVTMVFTSSDNSGGMTDHLSIAQVKADKAGQEVKVGGDVVPGSVSWDNVSGSLKFMITGDGDQIAVIYKGVAPSDFKPGSPLLVEGTYSSEGVILATSIETTTSPLCKACH